MIYKGNQDKMKSKIKLRVNRIINSSEEDIKRMSIRFLVERYISHQRGKQGFRIKRRKIKMEHIEEKLRKSGEVGGKALVSRLYFADNSENVVWISYPEGLTEVENYVCEVHELGHIIIHMKEMIKKLRENRKSGEVGGLIDDSDEEFEANWVVDGFVSRREDLRNIEDFQNWNYDMQKDEYEKAKNQMFNSGLNIECEEET